MDNQNNQRTFLDIRKNAVITHAIRSIFGKMTYQRLPKQSWISCWQKTIIQKIQYFFLDGTIQFFNLFFNRMIKLNRPRHLFQSQGFLSCRPRKLSLTFLGGLCLRSRQWMTALFREDLSTLPKPVLHKNSLSDGFLRPVETVYDPETLVSKHRVPWFNKRFFLGSHPRVPPFKDGTFYMFYKYVCSLFLIMLAVSTSVFAKCHGRFVNPMTDICWSCLFPITIGGMRVSTSGEDTPNPRTFLCQCSRPFPRIGFPVSFWEPVRLIDVTRTPYCMVNLGGITMMQTGSKQRGSVANAHTMGTRSRMRDSFYHVHWYVYPVIYWLELLVDFFCMEKGQFDVAYITELDPLWNDDETAFILNPEAVLFANPIAQAACAADCLAASSGFPNNALFWCGGCQGSLYPFTGTISHHVSGVQASLLIAQRMIAKLHREGLLWGTMGSDGFCDKYPMPILQKTQYKTQMLFPIPSTRSKQCYPLGRSDVLWGSGKEFPYGGEDFGYLIWRKRNCCLG